MNAWKEVMQSGLFDLELFFSDDKLAPYNYYNA